MLVGLLDDIFFYSILTYFISIVVYVCMATENAKMTNLIANYLVN